MSNVIKQKSPLVFPTNVTIIQKSTDGSLLRQQNVKNRVLKQYGLYSYVNFILGNFNDNINLNPKNYKPSYLAVGTNEGLLNGAAGTTQEVQITDVSLYHEILTDDNKTQRIKLNRATYVEDDPKQGYLKIQYEAYIPENMFVDEKIGEFALMTQNSGWNAFARISGFDVFEKTANSVIQIIWEIAVISVESSSRFVPVNKDSLKKSVDSAIQILYSKVADPAGYPKARENLYNLIAPSTTINTGLYYLLAAESNQITQADVDSCTQNIDIVLGYFNN